MGTTLTHLIEGLERRSAEFVGLAGAGAALVILLLRVAVRRVAGARGAA